MYYLRWEDRDLPRVRCSFGLEKKVRLAVGGTAFVTLESYDNEGSEILGLLSNNISIFDWFLRQQRQSFWLINISLQQSFSSGFSYLVASQA